MEHITAKLFLLLGVILLVGSYFAIHENTFAGVWMRWMGILCLLLTFAFRD